MLNLFAQTLLRRSFYFQSESLNLLLAGTKRLMIKDSLFHFILLALLFFTFV